MQLSDTIKQRVPFPALFRELFPEHYQERGNSRCPFHSDNNASFQASGQHGYCHAGCQPEQGKRFSVIDLWMRGKNVDFKTAVRQLAEKYDVRPDKKPDIVAAYDYLDESGAQLFQVVRYEPKTFRCRLPDGNGGWTWSMGDTRRVLYRLPEVLKSEQVWLCEGEKDADNLIALGLCGTTAPHGAQKWDNLVRKHQIHGPLRGKTAYILPDNDEPGRKHAEQIAGTLHGFAASVRILNLPGLPEKGDVCDFIKIHGPDAAKDALLEIAEQTSEWRLETKSTPQIPVQTFRDLQMMDIPPVQWVVPGFVPPGLLVIVAKSKMRKSWMMLNMSLQLAAGHPVLNHYDCDPCDTLYICLEDNLGGLRGRLEICWGDYEAPANAHFALEWPLLDRGGVELIGSFLDQHPATRFVVIDTYQRVRPPKRRGESDYESDYSNLGGLQKLAGEKQIAIFLVHHERKGGKDQSSDVYDAILGSTAIMGACDAAWILRRNRGDENCSLHGTGRAYRDDLNLSITFDKERATWEFNGLASDVNKSRERTEIRNVLLSHTEPVSYTEVAKCIGKKPGTVWKLLNEMVEDGQAERALRGKYMIPPEDRMYEPPPF